MFDLLKKFYKDEDGATIVEYIIMLAVVAGIVLLAFPTLRTSLSGWLRTMFQNVTRGLGGGEDTNLGDWNQ